MVHEALNEAIDRAKGIAMEKLVKERAKRRSKEIEAFLRQAPLKAKELEAKLRTLADS